MTIEIAADYALYVLARLLKKRRIALVLEREHITSHMVKEKSPRAGSHRTMIETPADLWKQTLFPSCTLVIC
jgi:hypothetical protein